MATSTSLHPAVPQHSNIRNRRLWLAALVTSQLAALVMAVVVMLVFTLFLGKGPLFPVQVIGSTIFGEPALHGFHAGAFLAGLCLHQLVALVWGVVFAFLARVLHVHTVKGAMLLGLAVAFSSMLDTYVVVPAVMHSLHGVDIWNREVPLFWNWTAHGVFGLSFGLFPGVRQWLLN